MLQSWRLSQKIHGQSQKNVSGRVVPSHITKLFVIFYGLIKMTSSCRTLESVPEKKIIEINTVYPPSSNHTQCYNMPSGHKFAFKISTEIPQLNMTMNNTMVASVLKEYYHYAYLFCDELEEEVRKMDFTFKQRTQILLATIVKENNKKTFEAPRSIYHNADNHWQNLWVQSGATCHICHNPHSTYKGRETNDPSKSSQHPPLHSIQDSLQLAEIRIRGKAIL
jgi:hypothetical protein